MEFKEFKAAPGTQPGMVTEKRWVGGQRVMVETLDSAKQWSEQGREKLMDLLEGRLKAMVERLPDGLSAADAGEFTDLLDIVRGLRLLDLVPLKSR